MASQKTKFTIGLFMTCGIGIAILALIWLGMFRYFEKGQYYVTYFNESVQGLDKDSSVKYRGVSVGRVESIDVAPDAKLIQVVLKIENVQELDKDIVAQLISVGITGSMFVELDRKKEGEADRSPALSFPSRYTVISSKPSNISELLQGIGDVLGQLQGLDLGGISGKIKLTLDNVNQMIVDANIRVISTSLEESLDDIGRIVDNKRWDGIMSSVEDAGHSLNSILDKTDKSVDRLDNTLWRLEGIASEKDATIRAAIDEFQLAMENANLFLKKGRSMMSGTDESLSYLRRHLVVVTQNLEKASDNLNRLIELVADHPPQLIFGKPPMPREVGQQ